MAIISTEYYSDALNRYARLRAVIPAEREGELLPGPFRTLYLLHGMKSDMNDWFYRTNITEIADSYRLAVIMPQGDNDFYIDFDKNDKLYGDFIGRELVETTRTLFPLSKNREDTFIGGLSMGGYGALRNGLKYYSTFGGIIALSTAVITADLLDRDSPSPFYENKGFLKSVFGSLERSENDLEALIRQVQKKQGALPPIYFACGRQDDFFQINGSFYELALSLGSACVWDERDGGHDWRFWNLVLEPAIAHFVK